MTTAGGEGKVDAHIAPTKMKMYHMGVNFLVFEWHNMARRFIAFESLGIFSSVMKKRRYLWVSKKPCMDNSTRICTNVSRPKPHPSKPPQELL